MTSRWLEIGDRVFVRRYAYFDQNIGLVLGDGEALVIDTRTTYVQAREILDRPARGRLARSPSSWTRTATSTTSTATCLPAGDDLGPRAMRDVHGTDRRGATGEASPTSRTSPTTSPRSSSTRRIASSPRLPSSSAGARRTAVPRPRAHRPRHRRHDAGDRGGVRGRPARERGPALVRRRLPDGLAGDRRAGPADRRADRGQPGSRRPRRARVRGGVDRGNSGPSLPLRRGSHRRPDIEEAMARHRSPTRRGTDRACAGAASRRAGLAHARERASRTRASRPSVTRPPLTQVGVKSGRLAPR